MSVTVRKAALTALCSLSLASQLHIEDIYAEETESSREENIKETSESNTYIKESIENEVRTSSTDIVRKQINGIYTVVKNDAFDSIAKSFNISPTQLRIWNNLASIPSTLKEGTKLAVTKQGVEQNLSDADKKKLVVYDKTASFNSAQEMIKELAPIVVEIARQNGEEQLWPSLMLAQAIHESGVEQTVGMSQKSRPPYHVLQGLKARGSVTSILDWTWEEIEVNDEKVNYQVIAEFQSFESYRAAIQGYADRLRYGPGWDSDYYSGTWVSSSDSVWDVLDNGGLTGYATDGSYVNKVKEKINEYNLTQYDTSVSRTSGNTRFDTATKISQSGWKTADNVIIANSHNFADALAGVPLASALDAPILLSRNDQIDQNTLNEIKRLMASNVVILGGEEALSKTVENQLKAQGLKITRYAGENRYQTAGLIASEVTSLTGSTEAILVSGENFADAMSIAPFAAQKGTPIYLTRSYTLAGQPQQASKSIKNWKVIGGPDAIERHLTNKFVENGANIYRIYGATRYNTNRSVIKYFGQNSKQLFVATGKDFVDALTGSVLAAKYNTGVLLADDQTDIMNTNINFSRDNDFYQFTIFGGKNVLSDRVTNSFKKFSLSGY